MELRNYKQHYPINRTHETCRLTSQCPTFIMPHVCLQGPYKPPLFIPANWWWSSLVIVICCSDALMLLLSWTCRVEIVPCLFIFWWEHRGALWLACWWSQSQAFYWLSILSCCRAIFFFFLLCFWLEGHTLSDSASPPTQKRQALLLSKPLFSFRSLPERWHQNQDATEVMMTSSVCL